MLGGDVLAEQKILYTNEQRSALLNLPTELLDIILEHIVGPRDRTIWAIHRYGPLCKDRKTAMSCSIHKDALLFPGMRAEDHDIGFDPDISVVCKILSDAIDRREEVGKVGRTIDFTD